MKERQQDIQSREEGINDSQPIQWSAFRKEIEEYFREQGASQQKAKINATKVFRRLTETSRLASRGRLPGITGEPLPEELIEKILNVWEETRPYKRGWVPNDDLRKNPFNYGFGRDNSRANEYLRATKAVIIRLRQG